MITGPPSPFPAISPHTVLAGTILHRIHGRAYAPDAFNPCQGRPTRFAPLRRVNGVCIPTAYAASSLECAVHETIFHDIPADAAVKIVRLGTVEGLDHAAVETQRDLTLCGLFEPDLNRWGLTRADLIDTLPVSFAQTALWAIAIHDARPDLDGLAWTSRRADPSLAYLLYGDRVASSDLRVRARRAIGFEPDLLEQLAAFGRRAGITLTM